jgi:EmrB/QacA subfamily drug resistance transporter
VHPVSTSAPSVAGRARTVALVAVLLAAFMDLMDVTILNVLMPSIEVDLHASPAQLEWMLSGYTLALALGLISGARLGDMFGRKRVFLIGVAGFAGASALCGVSTGADMLIAARVLQGLLAAVMIPKVLTQIQVLYAAHERGGAMAAYSALTGLAASVGPVLGPALLGWNLAGAGWRLVFFINVAVAVIAIPVCIRLLPESRPAAAARLELPGVAISAVGLLLVLYPLITAADRTGWPAWTYASLVAGVLVLDGFVVYQRRVSAHGHTPLLQVSLLRFRSVRGGLLTQLVFFIPVMGFFLIIMQFLQIGLAMSPMTAGLTMLPWSIATAVLAAVSAAVLLPRIGRATIQIGLVVLAIGFALVAVPALAATPQTGWVNMLAGMIIGGAGMGLVVAPLAQLTLTDVPVQHAGSGSALFNSTTQLAAAFGVAAIGSFFFTHLQPSGANPATLPTGYGHALATSLWLSIGLLAAAFAVTFILPRRPTQEEPSVSA